MINILTCLFFKFSFVALLRILFCFNLRTYIQIKYHQVPLQYCVNIRKEALPSYHIWAKWLTLIVRGSQLHIWLRGGLIQAPPGKCSINGQNELKFCVGPHMGCVWEIPWPNFKNFEIQIYFSFFCTELTSKNPKTLPIEFLVKKWSILM